MMETGSSSHGAPPLPQSSLRLLVSPLRLLLSAAWQVVHQSRVLSYDALADLVAVVTETVPELLAPSQRAELVLGLRARLILELCKADGPPDLVRIQANLEKIHACSAQLGSLHQEGGVKTLEASAIAFSQLVLRLISVPSEKEIFLKEVFPVTYGRVYDQTLRRLLAEFLSRVEQLLPNPTLTQTAAWLPDGPSGPEFSRWLPDPSPLETLLLHHRGLGALGHGPPRYEEVNTIMAALALPPPARGPRPEEGQDSGDGDADGDVLCGEEESRDSSTRPSCKEPPIKPTGHRRSPRRQPAFKMLKIKLHKISPPNIPRLTKPPIPNPPSQNRGVPSPSPGGAPQEAEEGAEQPPADKPKGRDRRFLSARPENPPHTDAETQCPRCGKSFLRPNQLKTHLKLHALPYRCLPCEKGFGSKSGYYQHQRLHRKGRAFPCGHCPLSFLCRYSLRQHERTHTEGPTHLCPECGKRFSKVSMVRHMRMHAGQKDFLCPACGKSFLSSGELLLHTRTHTRDTPYTCTLCGKGFTTKSHLVVHGRSHSGERPYPCAICPKRFITVSCLKRHMLSHDGVKPFSCPRCPKEFSQIGNLRRHMGTHPPPPPPHEGVTGDT
ncbi:zinc finger protein 316-like [Gadus chalcogrammus]|uniref:zinc finger protein 316-like n=1 Tax=Gadus chalcogrammus TaxID=1042646 RepID=UPI0024C38BC5|nr:zinc finger protein 316-like [Gadus chalcogrammus]